MRHVKTITVRYAQLATETSESGEVDLPFMIASLQFVLTILQALQTKKQLQEGGS